MTDPIAPVDPANAPPFKILVHASERRRARLIAPAQAGGSTCCCCCCLHAVGGIIGAAIAPNLGHDSRPRSSVPLMNYWDDERYKPSQHGTSDPDPHAI